MSYGLHPHYRPVREVSLPERSSFLMTRIKGKTALVSIHLVSMLISSSPMTEHAVARNDRRKDRKPVAGVDVK